MLAPSPPSDYVTLVTLADATVVGFRIPGPQDQAALQAFTTRQPDFAASPFSLPPASPTPPTVFIAMRENQVIALGRYQPTGPTTAEVTLLTAPPFQDQGVGDMLLQVLAAHAYGARVRTLTTRIETNNKTQRTLFQTAALNARFAPSDSSLTALSLDLEPCAPLQKTLRSYALFRSSPTPLLWLLQNLKTQRQSSGKSL